VSNDNKNCNSDSLLGGGKVSEDCVAHVNLTCHTANASTCCSYKDNKLQISANCRVTTFCIAHSCASFNREVTYSVAKKTKIQTKFCVFGFVSIQVKVLLNKFHQKVGILLLFVSGKQGVFYPFKKTGTA